MLRFQVRILIGPFMTKTMQPDPPSYYWFIYNPSSLTAPTKQFASATIAQMVADTMAKKHVGEKFYVMKVQYVSSTEYVVNTGWAKESFKAE